MSRNKPFDAKKFIAELPTSPGVYQMLDSTGQIIYVGKARILKNRVSSYFNGSAKDNKTMALVRQIADMRYHITQSEGDALILENQLIKKHTPKYNILLKDGKSYPYIYISTDADEFPRITYARGKKKRKGRYFGPYPSSPSVRYALNFLQKVFKVRQCTNSFYSNRSRPCLQHQINRCTAPCVGLVSKKDYQKQIKYTIDFIEGKSSQVVDSLVKEMEQASADMSYELAAEIRDQIKAIRSIQSHQAVETGLTDQIDVLSVGQEAGLYIVTVGTVRNGQFLGNRNHFPNTPKDITLPDLLHDFISQYYDEDILPNRLICNIEPSDKNDLAELLSVLKGKKVFITAKPRGQQLKLLKQTTENMHNALQVQVNKYASWQKKWDLWVTELGFKTMPERIECFDISHQMGEHTRASCVVFDAQGADKKMYRQYIISGIQGGDDYAAMSQVIEKRLDSLKKRDIPLPDAFIIDGGKGQVNQAVKILKEQNLESVRIIGVTKDENRTAGNERIYLPERHEFISPEPHGLLSLMMQHIRDEAHRFAIKSHRKAFKKSRNTSLLENIPGIGQARRNQLLKHFGGLQGLKQAGIDDIQKVPGISEKLAQEVFSHLHQ
ncbi:UvrABC system protein C [Marinicella pacifica]|uniref:UvrABC system protein C n=1 Tax=Marinicella pacifica TaxID=1171543 RepID=A0A917FHK1_9GAMM|nr:excinuclease ABC subunit UvrC [Marinicella pacifica]GGF83633.1 UvrABC system protein C [Marinicella pacifica]